MKLLLLGASSYVGARLYLDLHKKYSVTGTYHHTRLSNEFIQLDVTQSSAVKNLVTQIKPDVIVHCANNGDPRWCEANPVEAKAINQTGTQTVVDAANSVGAKLIYISSYAAANPINTYGYTKIAAEEITKQTKASWIILRPGYIVGYSPNTTNDRPFNRFLKIIDQGTPAEYDTGWQVQVGWLGHVSEVIDGVLQNNINNKTLHVAAPELKTRYELARDILQPFGVKVKAIDVGETAPPFDEDVSTLKKLGLPTYSYNDVVERSIQEINHPENFKL